MPVTGRSEPRLFTIPPGAPFLPSLAEALAEGRLVPGFRADGDPLAWADATIYVPTRRAARELRSVLVDRAGGRAAILPTIRALGEVDDDAGLFLPASGAEADLAPPISVLDRLLLLAPLVQAWKRRLPAHVAALFEEEVVVPASAADAVWLARDLAALLDEVETEGVGWANLQGLVERDLAGWWQVTLDFLNIVIEHWPNILADRQRSDPVAHRDALLRAEAARLAAHPPAGPVVAAGSTGSIPATAELLSVIARLPNGAVVLPGFDRGMDARSRALLEAPTPQPAVLGHPQYGMLKLLRRIGVTSADVADIAEADADLALRARLVAEAFRPADTTDQWTVRRSGFDQRDVNEAVAGISLVEAANERDEAVAIAIALRQAVEAEGRTAALVTGDRELARRVCAELARFGIRADDSGGTPLSATPPGRFLTALTAAVFCPGDPVPVLALLSHPLLRLGHERAKLRRAAELIELVALRGGTGRPDVMNLADLFEERAANVGEGKRPPPWLPRFGESDFADARAVLVALSDALAPLGELRTQPDIDVPTAARATVLALEAAARASDSSLGSLYDGDPGERLAAFLRGLVGAEASFRFEASEWPDVLEALLAPEVVKPSQGLDPRVSIWGTLEARLLSPDTLVVGGLNEGVWPRRATADRFMSRVMKSGLELEPPERRIGQAAHDFQMALGIRNVVLTRSARAGDAPAVASRWLQRLLTFAGEEAATDMRRRGEVLLGLARIIDDGFESPAATRPNPAPPVEARPRRFSVTEIETLRRDPYAVYARRILRLMPLDPLVSDPGPAERGTLFHLILHRFSASCVDPCAPGALDALLAIGRECFAEAELPPDVEATWRPRFEQMAPHFLKWEQDRAASVLSRHPELRAECEVGRTGVTLTGYADRIDRLTGGMAEIIDYKSGTSPSKTQAHRLIAPQLALEAAMLRRGAFAELSRLEPSDLLYVRLKSSGEVKPESILSLGRNISRTAADLGEEAWERLQRLIEHYELPHTGYLSRALPFREGDVDGDYDHLARVLEWSAGRREGGGE